MCLRRISHLLYNKEFIQYSLQKDTVEMQSYKSYKYKPDQLGDFQLT